MSDNMEHKKPKEDVEEHLPDFLHRLKAHVHSDPPEGYFDQLQVHVFNAININNDAIIRRFSHIFWNVAAAIAIAVAASFWMFNRPDQKSTEFEWVMTEAELMDFLDSHIDELDKSFIYATAEDEGDLFISNHRITIDSRTIDLIINSDDDFEKLLIEE